MLFQELFQEGFATAVPWRWIERKSFEFVASFKIDKVSYTTSIFQYDTSLGAWDLSFTAATKKRDFGFARSATGNALQVFGTVIAIARQFIALKQPKVLKIESDMSERPTRLKMNQHLAKAIANGLNFTVSVTPDADILLQQKTERMIEAKDSSYVNMNGDHVAVYRNPSQAEMAGLMRRSPYHMLRGLMMKTDNNVYLWDAGQATHYEIARDHGFGLIDCFGFEVKDGTACYLVNPMLHSDIDPAEVVKRMQANPVFRALTVTQRPWRN